MLKENVEVEEEEIDPTLDLAARFADYGSIE